MTTREGFLQRVRQSVSDGNRAGAAAPLPERGNVGVGHVPPGVDPVERFCTGLVAAGGMAHVVAQESEAIARILQLIEERKARRILLARHALFDRLQLAKVLRDRGLDVVNIEELTAATRRDPFFAADLGISVATYVVAETGTIVLASSLAEPRSVSLLPPVHIVLVEKKQILADLFDVFARFPATAELPSCLTLITGPSKTGDIELRLVTGVHGPGEVHVVLGPWD